MTDMPWWEIKYTVNGKTVFAFTRATIAEVETLFPDAAWREIEVGLAEFFRAVEKAEEDT